MGPAGLTGTITITQKQAERLQRALNDYNTVLGAGQHRLENVLVSLGFKGSN